MKTHKISGLKASYFRNLLAEKHKREQTPSLPPPPPSAFRVNFQTVPNENEQTLKWYCFQLWGAQDHQVEKDKLNKFKRSLNYWINLISVKRS